MLYSDPSIVCTLDYTPKPSKGEASLKSCFSVQVNQGSRMGAFFVPTILEYLYILVSRVISPCIKKCCTPGQDTVYLFQWEAAPTKLGECK